MAKFTRRNVRITACVGLILLGAATQWLDKKKAYTLPQLQGNGAVNLTTTPRGNHSASAEQESPTDDNTKSAGNEQNDSVPATTLLDPFVDLTYTTAATRNATGSDGFGMANASRDDDSLNRPLFSSVHCVASGLHARRRQSDAESYLLRRPNFVSRTCWYRNLYYKLSDQTFHYFASPAESRLWDEARQANNVTFQELYTRMEVCMGHTDDMWPRESLTKMRVVPWKPIVHEHALPPSNGSVATVATRKKENATAKKTDVFLLYQPYHSHNFGHFLWDDLQSLYALLDLFRLMHHDARGSNTSSNHVVPIPLFVEQYDPRRRRGFGGPDPQYRCSPTNVFKWMRCVKTYRRAFPLFGIRADSCSGDILRTGNWLRGEAAIGTWRYHPKQASCNATGFDGLPSPPQRRNHPPATSSKLEYLRLPNVMAGTGRHNEFGCTADCTIGRGPQIYGFRNFMLCQLFGLSANGDCELATRAPAGYITFSLPIGSSRPEQVYFFQEEIALARQHYGAGAVKVVDFANMTLQEQVLLAQDSAVLVTNHGGGAAVSIFLQQGSSVLVFWHNAYRSDHPFFESAGYFRTNWVSVQERAFVNQTMALIAREVEITALQYPGIVSAQQVQNYDVPTRLLHR